MATGGVERKRVEWRREGAGQAAAIIKAVEWRNVHDRTNRGAFEMLNPQRASKRRRPGTCVERFRDLQLLSLATVRA